ncbi:hypothetical protein L7F22_039030 [Adiantum nelumboides]|nr:hypothetical protein [Adiantum nelumboides]
MSDSIASPSLTSSGERKSEEESPERGTNTISTTITVPSPLVEENAPPAQYMRLSRISCDPCRKRKLRCSRTMPCTTCVKRGIADKCYQETHAEDGRGSTHSTPAASTSKIRHAASPSDHSITHASPSNARRSFGGEHITKRQKKNSISSIRVNGEGHHHSNGSGPILAGADQIHHDLSTLRQQLRSLSSITNASESSIEAVLQSMQAGRANTSFELHSVQGSGPDGLVRWNDVSPHLPSLDECEELIRLFFEDLGYYFRVTQRSMIDKYWHKLLEGAGLERNKMRIICIILTLANGTAPPKAKVHRASLRTHHEWINLMGNPLTTPFGQHTDNSFESISALMLLAIYYMFIGKHDRIWECMGVAVRKGFNLGLFDERHRAWGPLSNLEKEYRRRLAWYLLSLERWQAFMRQLPSALHPDNVHISLPSFEHDSVVARGQISAPQIMPTFPMTMADGRLQTHVRANDGHVVKFVFIELLAVCHEFLDRFSSLTASQRYNRAQQIDDLLERTMIDGLTDAGVELTDLRYLRYLSSQSLETCPKEKQLGISMWLSHLFFLRCTITRRFLTDENAPAHLRFVSLTYAQGIVSAIPTLTRIVKEGSQPVQMTWNANHLLCAATAFAVVILGHDPYAGIDSDPLRALTGKSRRSSFPQEQVQWLADNIFSTLECLDFLVDRGNGTALVAKQLLESLVGSQEELRTLYRQRMSIGNFNNEMTRNKRESLPPMQDSLYAPNYNALPNLSSRSPSSHRSPSSSVVGTPVGVHASTPTHQSSTPSYTYQQPRSLPPIQPYPPITNRSNSSYNAGGGNAPIIGRFINASSLLDAVLMEPLDPDFVGKSNTSDLLASLLQQE